jgi:small lipoprotein (TIGR04454 family)
VPPSAKVTQADCLAVFDHLIEIDIKERPADHQLTAEQRASTRAAMEKELMGQCLELSTQQVACLRASATTQGARACEQSR